jgi:hypothetical protein
MCGGTIKKEGHFTYTRNIDVRSRNHYYCGKAISITYSESVPVVFVIQHAMRMRYIIIFVLSGSTIQGYS